MQFILEWLQEQANILTMLQIFLDLMLALLVIILLTRKPKAVNPSAYEELTTSLEKIIHETSQLASDFETNLQERHKLINQITSQLDSRLNEARTVCSQLETLVHQSAEQAARPEPVKRNSDHQDVLRLARKGLRVEAIARQLRKPLGEVELILKLNKLSGS
jgi:hypothetical protein